MKLPTLIVLSAMLASAALAAPATPPVKIIFDTDMETDCDDAGALAVLHALADRGECEILAVMVSAKNPWSAPACDVINTYYGRPDIPIGGPKSRPAPDKPSRYARQLAEQFPHDLKSGEDALDAAELYRDILLQHDAGTVTIVTVGYMTNLRDLLKLPAAGGKPAGAEVVKRARLWVCMGGNFIGHPAKDDLKLGNNNFTFDAPAAHYAIHNWPGPIVFVGREVASVPSGLRVGENLKNTPMSNPVRVAYRLYHDGQDRSRHVADPASVLYAVRGLRDYWDARTSGFMDLTPDMTFEWRGDIDRRHGYLLKKQVDGKPNDRYVEQVLDELMTQTPRGRGDILFADFESETYGQWTVTGEAFGKGPVKGTLPNQMRVSGYEGERLVNSFFNGDRSTGRLTSPPFKVERRYINFLIGGGGHAGQTCMNLLVDGKVVRTATGPNTKPGGSEELEPAAWDVAEFAGRTAVIEIVDEATGGWGHINVDHIVFSDTKNALVTDASRELVAERKYLHLPVKNDARARRVKVMVDGQAVREFDIEIGASVPDWHALLDISAWAGKTLKVQVDRLPASSNWLASLEQGDQLKGAEDLYREPLRPQLHVSPRRGWNNDPNGMVFYNGEYHLFFQYNPYGVEWGNMHWGHFVSRDLVTWRELPIALYPDRFGTMWSGSAVVDWKNTSGFGRDGRPPMVLLYTAAGDPFTQCLAYSTDGRTFTKYEKNPVIGRISGGTRDPKVIWHEPTQRWVMVLYVDRDRKHFIDILTSPDLKNWTPASSIESFYECPDLFELPVDGDAKNTRWVLTGASSEYFLGTFDGKTFTPQTPVLKGHLGKGFYAAQTFSDTPDGRRIQVGWLQARSPGMPFNQAMTVPLELKLISTAEGPRMTFAPVKELAALRARSQRVGPVDLKPGADNPFAGVSGELLEVRVEFEPASAAEVELVIRGVRVRYDTKKQELVVNDHRAPAPLREGRQRLVILTDRTAFEIFASDGLTYVPFPVIPRAEDRGVRMQAIGGAAKILSAEVHELRSIWGNEP